MKEGIHPTYGPASVHCACGNVIETRSTVTGTIRVEICSACHPFFTGQQKLIDTAGRIDRFKKKFGDRVVLGTQTRQKKAAPPPPPPKKKEAAKPGASLMKEKMAAAAAKKEESKTK